MNDADQQVYRCVRGQIEAGQVVNRSNKGPYGPRQIAKALEIGERDVRTALTSLIARTWLECANGRIALGAGAPALDELPKPERPRLAISLALAERIGMQTNERKPEPLIMLDHALRWARDGVNVFPCRRFLGSPLVTRWYAAATKDAGQIIEWWSDHVDADIAAVPDQSGHFVIVASGEEGADSLAAIEAEYGPLPAEFRYQNRLQDSEHLWLRGSAVTSHNRLGPGLHVLGRGHYVYLSPSWAPDHHWKEEIHA